MRCRRSGGTTSESRRRIGARIALRVCISTAAAYPTQAVPKVVGPRLDEKQSAEAVHGGVHAGTAAGNATGWPGSLGETALSALRRVHLPLLMPALGAAALLVFVDAMKELPATLLLRPFNFETLATHVYTTAALDPFESATVGALTIVLIGLLPVLLLHRAVAGGRAGS